MKRSVALQVLLFWCALGAWVYLTMGREAAPLADVPPTHGEAGRLAATSRVRGTPAIPPLPLPLPLSGAAVGPPTHLAPHDCYYSRLRAATDLTREEAVAMLVVAEPTDESLANQECGVWPPPVSP